MNYLYLSNVKKRKEYDVQITEISEYCTYKNINSCDSYW
ncbi:hypothetical protein Catovirus_1_303 [Catovirus CTV1]|uniref:Uncharacterized protein n=1 Tax=Catovirus CTV1 TaxID=1977631 RepID=A0A1V0S974_9VIRU|nr:hypothetical protein Catovirus_1_303 [Catovirus CTV1]